MGVDTVIGALSDPGLWIAAFAGGAFGAALGALPAFIFTGFMVIFGEAANRTGVFLSSNIPGVSPDDIAIGITGSVAFGPVFGPHVSFAGGAAAAAYAAEKGYMDTGFDYHEAKNIAHALGTKPDVLAVGGLFGMFGMVVGEVSGGLGLPWDPIAFGVVISAVAHRLVFGYSLIGTVRGKNIFDMTPFERGEMHSTAEGGNIVADGGESVEAAETGTKTETETQKTNGDEETVSDGDTAPQRLLVEPWLPQQYRWSGVAMIGLVVGILGGYLVVSTGSVFLGFGISAATLVFLNCGVENIPVTHHISLPASTAAAALAGGTASMPMLPSLAIAAVFGISGALTGEIVQRVFYAHADTHFDPPATAIAINTFFIGMLFLLGVFPESSWIPVP